MLIYLGPHLQNKLIPLFHFALRPNGYLFLGPSENITSHGDLFRVIDSKHRISQRKGTAIGTAPSVSAIPESGSRAAVDIRTPDATSDLTAMRQRILIDEFAPKSCVIDESGQILDASAHLEKYLSINDGSFQSNIVRMAASGLRIGLRAALADAKRTVRRVTHENLSVRVGDKIQRVMITIQPMPRLGEDEPLYMVVFHDVGLPVDRDEAESPIPTENGESESMIAQMERELETTRSDLDRTMQDMEAAIEELKSSNEELLSMNEELQSANEELETSKEEIHATSDAVARANDDLENLLRSTRIATVFLDDNFRIRSFTPAIREIYDLIPTDVGRPLERFVPNVKHMPPLRKPLLDTVQASGESVDESTAGDDSETNLGATDDFVTADHEDIIEADNGRFYARKMLPYTNASGQRDGFVVTFADVTALKRSEQRLSLSLHSAEMDAFDVDLTGGGIVFEGAIGERFGRRPGMMPENYLPQIHPDDREVFQTAVFGCTPDTASYTVTYRSQATDGHYYWLREDGRVIFDLAGQPVRVTGVVRDVTEQQESQRRLEASERQLQTFADTVPPLMAIIDTEERFLFANRAYAEYWQRPIDDIIGRRVDEVVSADAYVAIAPNLARAIAGEQVKYELHLKRPGTGEPMCEEVVYVPQRNDDDDVELVHVVITDMTEIKNTQEQLSAQNSRLNLSLEAGKMGSWDLNIETGELTWDNANHRLFGSNPAEPMTNEKALKLVHADDLPELQRRLEVCIRDLVDFDHEFRVVGPGIANGSGQVRWLAGRGKVVTNDDGKPARMMGVNWDITKEKETETELADREAHLRRVIDNMLSLLAVLAPDGTLLDVNQTGIDIGGLERDEVIGKPFWDCYWWSFDDEVVKRLRQAIQRAASGEVVRYDETNRMANDSRMVIDFMIAPVSDADGNVTQLIASAVDVSDRKNYELQLQNAERFSRTVLESSPDCVKVLDGNSCLKSMNVAGMCQMEIDDFEPLKGQPWWSLWPEESQHLVKDAVEQAEEAGEGRFQAFCPTAKGTPKWWDVIVTPVRDDLDDVQTFVSVSRDITEQRKWSQELIDREAHLRRVINNQLGLVGVIDRDGRLVEVDDRSVKIAQVAREDVIGKHFASAPWWTYDLAVADQMRNAMERAFAGEIVRYDVSLFAHGDDGVMIDFMIAPVENDQGEIEYLIPSGVEIVDRKWAETELRASREQLRLGLEVSEAGIARIEYATNRVLLSAQAAKLYGLGDREIDVSRGELHATFHPDERAELESAIRTCLESDTDAGKTLVRQHRVVLPDGAVRWLDVRKQIICDDNGNPSYSILAARNITADRRRQEAFRFRSALADKLVAIKDVRQIQQIALREIAAHFGASRTHLAYFDLSNDTAEVPEEFRPDGSPSIIGNHDLHAFLTASDLQRLQNLQPTVFDDVSTDDRTPDQLAAFDAIGIRSLAQHYYSTGPNTCETVAVAKDHPYRWHDDEIELLRDLGVLVYSRVQAAEADHALAAAADRLNTAMQTARMGSFEWNRETGETVWDNQWCDMAGLPHDIERDGDTFFSFVHPDDLAALHEVTDRSQQDRCDYRSEFRIVSHDGETRWLAGSGSWQEDEHGNKVRLVGLNWDITEQKQAALDAKANEQRLRLAAEAAGFGTFHVDIDAKEVAWSDEMKKLLGLGSNDEPKPEIGVVPSFVHPQDRDKVKRYMDKVLSSRAQADHGIVHRIIRPDNEIRHVRMQSRSLFDGNANNKRLRMIVGTLLDISRQQEYEFKLKQAREQAEAASESKSAFVANMSHEIRTPMTAILGYADLIRDCIDDPQALEHVQTIRRNGDYLLEIINDILDLSKIEAGKFDIESERFSPAAVVEDVRSIMGVRASDGGLDLDVVYESTLPESISSDAKRLKQVLINLVGNAIKFTREGQVTVNVRVEEEKQLMFFDITDTGIGMSDAQQERLFKPFSQGDSSVTRNYGGTGLGLAISQRLAEMLGGQISAKSVEGTGSTFSVSIATGDLSGIRLRDYSINFSETPEEPTNDTTQADSLSCRVLVVDDRRDIRFLSKMILTKCGAAVDECEDGLIAVEYITSCLGQDSEPDLILLDMQMPNLDGYETARALRKLGYAKPIIALTADAMQGDMNACLDAGCDGYLSKPIDAARLVQLVGELTNRNQ